MKGQGTGGVYMGKGSKPHEEVVKYLCSTFGQYNHEDCVLKKIYPSDWEKQYIKERILECDYVVKKRGT